jgi:hypothetical protein
MTPPAEAGPVETPTPCADTQAQTPAQGAASAEVAGSGQLELGAPVAAQIQAKGKGQLSSDRVQNPHDPDATYGVKGEGQKKKEHVGYKVQVAETVSEVVLASGEPTRKAGRPGVKPQDSRNLTCLWGRDLSTAMETVASHPLDRCCDAGLGTQRQGSSFQNSSNPHREEWLHLPPVECLA